MLSPSPLAVLYSFSLLLITLGIVLGTSLNVTLGGVFMLIIIGALLISELRTTDQGVS